MHFCRGDLYQSTDRLRIGTVCKSEWTSEAVRCFYTAGAPPRCRCAAGAPLCTVWDSTHLWVSGCTDHELYM